VTAQPDYLAANRILARRFLGQRLTRLVRLLGDGEPADSPRFGPSEALLDGDHGDQWLVSSDAALANVVLADAATAQDALNWLKELYPGQLPITEAVPGDPLGFLLREEIVAVEVASRQVPDEPGTAFTMCGIRLTTTGGDSVCFGTHLSALRQPELGFYLPGELDPELAFTELTATRENS
jgi:hypothetical protein